MVTSATGLGSAIEFRVEGGPVDEPETGEERLTLVDAVRRSLSTDPRLQAAFARVRIAMSDADQARLLPNPILNLAVRLGNGGSSVIEASLTQDLIQVLQQRRRASAADHRLRKAALEAVTTALDVVLDVQERYAQVQASDRLVPVLEGRAQLQDKVLEVARSRLAAGEGIRNEVTTLEAQGVELQVELSDARLGQREARVRLARLLGTPGAGATWQLEPMALEPARALSERAWIDAGLAHRPEVHAKVWELAALGDDAALAKLFPFEGLAGGIEAERDDAWTIGPAIATPIPIFDMGQARQARVTAEMIEARHDLTLIKRQVVEEVRVAYQDLSASLENLDRVRHALLPLQAQRREQAEEAYRAGLSDVTSLYLAEQDLRAAEVRLVELAQKAAIARVRLQRAVGGPAVEMTMTEPGDSGRTSATK